MARSPAARASRTCRATGGRCAFQAVGKLTAIDPGANVPQVYVRDLAAATTTMASVTPGGVAPNNFAERSDISADGRYVSFVSDATNIAPEDTDATRDVFRRDLAAGTTIAVTSGAQNADSPAINGDGSRIVFETFEQLDPAADVNAADRDVYLRDIAAGTTRLASLRGSLVDDANESRGRDVSADGTRVPFDNGGVYVRDLVANAPLTVSANPTATFSSINGGGTFAGFLLGTGPQIGQLTAGNDVAGAGPDLRQRPRHRRRRPERRRPGAGRRRARAARRERRRRRRRRRRPSRSGTAPATGRPPPRLRISRRRLRPRRPGTSSPGRRR